MVFLKKGFWLLIGSLAFGAFADVFDVLVVGGTERGVRAATEAAKNGKSVFLVTPHPYLGEDLAGTLELGFGKDCPTDPLGMRLWRNESGLAAFDYWPERETDGIRWIYWNDRMSRLSESGRPPTMDDGVLYADDIGVRCVLRHPARIGKVKVLVLEADESVGSNLMREADYARIARLKPGARRVGTESVEMKFLAGPKKGEVVTLKRTGESFEVPRGLAYPTGRGVFFEAPVDNEISEALVTVRVDSEAHHQLVSRIWFQLADASRSFALPSPLKVKRTFDRELIDAGVGFLTSSPVRRVLRDASGKMTGVEIVNRSGREVVRAAEIVDATRYGLLGKVPAVASEESFSRVVIADRDRPQAPGMTVEELPAVFENPHSGLTGRMYRCTFKLPMKDGSYPSFAAAEWAARELTRLGRPLDAADLLVWHPESDALANSVPMADELPEWGDFDVVVIGGGTAGAPAGIAAARSGAKTLIVEYRDMLGGVGTDGMVLGYFDGNHCGFTKEFEDACASATLSNQYYRAEVWRNMCNAAGATVWLGAMGLGVVREGRKVVGVEVSTPLGTGIVRAKCVIDGTGNSDVAAVAGAETEFVSAAEIAVQSAGQSPQRLDGGCINSDFGYLNDADARDLWLFGVRARAGAPDAWDIAKLPDSRERRRIVPDERLTGEDVVARRTYPDTVAQALSRQDPHGFLTDDFGYLAEVSTEQVPSADEKRAMYRVNLPLRCLLPKGVNGLAVVGLSAGIERDVVAITRMQADLMNMGYGVGLAAAQAAKNGGDFRTIDLAVLRRQLVEKGILGAAALGWMKDEDVSSDAVLAAAVKTLPDGYRGGHVLYRPENRARVIPLLRAAYRAAAESGARQTYALALGLMGDATGVETLLACARGDEKIVDVRPASHGPNGKFASSYSAGRLRDGILLALARTGDRRGTEPLLRELRRITASTPFNDVRKLMLAIEASGDPAFAETLAKLLTSDGVGGHAVSDARVLPPLGGYGIGLEFERCFRELSIARALFACGDFNGLARRTYEAYAKDPRGLLSAHAKAGLSAVPAGWIDFNKNGVKDIYEDPARPVEERVRDLLSQMTVEEKTCQLATLYGSGRVLKDCQPTEEWKNALWKDGIANIDEELNGVGPCLTNGWYDMVYPFSNHVAAVRNIQRWFVEETRLGIPVDFSNEGVHGLNHTKATPLPAPIGIGSTWNRALVREAGEIVGREARLIGYSNVYAPILDVARDPRWGRTLECYGEDPYLVGTLGSEMCAGIQSQGVASTLKHYAVYSVPKGGRDGECRTDPHVTPRELHEIFLAPFRQVIRKARPMGVMCSYNDWNGEPIAASRYFLTDLLRGEYGFDGYVVSDSEAVEYAHTKHAVAETPGDAARMVLEAGLNVRTHFTPPEDFVRLVREQVERGRLPMSVVDRRVAEVLSVKFRLGLFDNPYLDDAARADAEAGLALHLDFADRIQAESFVLLKNNGTLPLDKSRIRRVLVTGPLADERNYMTSRYGPNGHDAMTIRRGLVEYLSGAAEVIYKKGCETVDSNWPDSEIVPTPLSGEEEALIGASVAAAVESDVVVAVLGEDEKSCGESRSRTSLELPGRQQVLLDRLLATGKPVVVVLVNGQPLTVNVAERRAAAILETWFPGCRGGRAVARTLFGEENPSGKLTVTFPKSVGQVEYNFPYKKGAHGKQSKWVENPNGSGHTRVEGPLYPFGHGLSYTGFAYSNLTVGVVGEGKTLRVSVSCDVTNVGRRAGAEVVQLYVRDEYSSVVTYDSVLRGFEKVFLNPGESRRVSFVLKPEDLAILDRDMKWTVEPGGFEVRIGSSSEDIRLRDHFTVL